MQDIDEEALRAASDPLAAELFIARNRQFILRCASRFTHRYITDSDDEWSVAMIAFSDSLALYQSEKGSFLSFAELIIRRRLTDHLRSESEFFHEISVSPSIFQGQATDSEESPGLQEAIIHKAVWKDRSDLTDEIEAVGQLLKNYGISFYDLPQCSPKAEKTRRLCALAIRYLIKDPILLSQVRCTSSIPLKSVCSATGIPRKALERHRKYIIAAMEILLGDFPGLQEYLRYI